MLTFRGRVNASAPLSPPLRNPDDTYIITGLGDETTVQFDATSASALPVGWKRDFLLYADGWIKDSADAPLSGTAIAQPTGGCPAGGSAGTSPQPGSRLAGPWLGRGAGRTVPCVA